MNQFTEWTFELDEYLNKYRRILFVALLLLVYHDTVDVAVRRALIYHLTLKVLIHILCTDHVTKDHHTSLETDRQCNVTRVRDYLEYRNDEITSLLSGNYPPQT